MGWFTPSSSYTGLYSDGISSGFVRPASSQHGGSSHHGSSSGHHHHHSSSSHHHHRSSSPHRSTRSSYSPTRSHRGGSSGSSYYKRSPRGGYIARMIHNLKHFFRKLVSYARRHPVKVFMLVIMPLVTGGALQGILRSMGVRMPAGMMRGLSQLSDNGRGGRGGSSSGIAGLASMAAGGGGVGSLLKVVQAFM